MTSPIANLKKSNMPPTEVKSFGNNNRKEHRNSIQEKIKENIPRLSKHKNDAGSQEDLLFLMSKRITKLEDTVNQVTQKLEQAVELIAMKDMEVEQLKAELSENGKKTPRKGKRIHRTQPSSTEDLSEDKSNSSGESSNLSPITEGTVFDEKRKHEFLKELTKARADLKSAENEYDSQDVNKVLNKNSDELEKEYLRLANQVAEMEAFLADYGLIWIGDPVTKDKGDDSSAVIQTSIIFSPDFNKIFVVIDELNGRAENESNIKYTANGATFKKADILDLTLYADGIQLEDNDFRQYSSASVQEFFRDLEDGYYPTELKGRHPEGVIFKIIDKRTQPYKEAESNTSQPFSGKGHRLGSSEEVRKVPPYPGPSGRHLKSEGNKGDVKQMLEDGTAPYKPVMTRTMIYADVAEESDEGGKKKPDPKPLSSKFESSDKSNEIIKSEEIITKKKPDLVNVTTSVTELDNGLLSRTVVDLDKEASDVRSRPHIVKTVPPKVKVEPSVEILKSKKPSEEKLIKVKNMPMDDDKDVIQFYEDKMGTIAQKVRRNLHPKETTTTTIVKEGESHKKPLYRDNINVTNITYHEAPLYVTIKDDGKSGKTYYRGRADLDGDVELDYVDDEEVRHHPYYNHKYGAPSEYEVDPRRTSRSPDGYPRGPYSAEGDPRGPYSAEGDPRGPYSAEATKRMYGRQAYDAADAARGGRPPSIREGYSEYADRYGRTADAIREQYKKEQQKIKHQTMNPNEKFEHFTYLGRPNEETVEPTGKVEDTSETLMKTHVKELDDVPEEVEDEDDDGLTPKEINAGGLSLNDKTSKEQIAVKLRSTDGSKLYYAFMLPDEPISKLWYLLHLNSKHYKMTIHNYDSKKSSIVLKKTEGTMKEYNILNNTLISLTKMEKSLTKIPDESTKTVEKVETPIQRKVLDQDIGRNSYSIEYSDISLGNHGSSISVKRAREEEMAMKTLKSLNETISKTERKKKSPSKITQSSETISEISDLPPMIIRESFLVNEPEESIVSGKK